MKKKNKIIKNICIYLIIFIILLVAAVLQSLDLDQVWSYGFSYNISRGLIPYKDFNMIVGPLYSIIFSLPMIIFGNYIIAYKILHIMIYSLILTIAYQKIGKKTIWLILLLYIQTVFCSYNVFAAMITILILLLLDSDKKYKDLVIGILIGIIIVTKHNIGLAMFIVYFFTSKKKLISILNTSIPVIVSLIYLLCTNSLLEYLNFCIFGMGGFISNLRIEIVPFILTILLIIHYVRRYIKLKDSKILYILSFLIIVFPLIENIHLCVGLIPIVYYILKEEYNTNIYKLMIVFIVFGLISATIPINNLEIVLDNNFYKYNSLEKGVSQSIENYSDYIKKIDGNVYIFIANAYSIKLIDNQTTTFYDLINKGNLGKNENKYIDLISEKCKKEKCTFILDKKYFQKPKIDGWQMSTTFKDYVIENYNYVETIPSGDRLYNNEKN